VLRYYQAPGDVWSCIDEDLRRTAAIVLQHLGAARAARAHREAAPARAAGPAGALLQP